MRRKAPNRMASRTPVSIERKARLAAAKAQEDALKERFANILCGDAEDWTDDDRAFLDEHHSKGWWPL